MLGPLPAIAPRGRTTPGFARKVPPLVPLNCLAAGWSDFRASPMQSVVYGLAVFAASVAVIRGLVAVGLPSLFLPTLSGFLVVGPLLAIGLSERSPRLHTWPSVSLASMIAAYPRSGGPLVFARLLQCMLAMLWLRAADLLGGACSGHAKRS